MSKIRNHHFDNIRGLLIFLVVLGHMIEPLRDILLFKTVYLIIYSFHMPLFIFLSGYFAKPNTKGIKELVKYLVKYEIIYAIAYVVIFGDGSGGAPSGDILHTIAYVLQPIWVLWFLLSLICWRLLLIAYEKHPVFLITIIALIIGFNFIPFDFRILSIGRTLTFFPYFLLGYLVKKHNINLYVHRKKRVTLYFLFLIVIFWTTYSGTFTEDMLYGATSLTTQGPDWGMLTLLKVNTYLVATATSVIVLNLVPTTENFFTKIGPNTLPIFLWHPIFIWVLIRITFFDKLTNFNDVLALLILTILSLLLTLFLKDRRV